jgi:hypothetical protein
MATCDKDYIADGEALMGGKDDRVFRLDRVNKFACVGIKP